ncbi:MAG: dienelactone hydrolase family protein [Rickettsiaceae bacterium]
MLKNQFLDYPEIASLNITAEKLVVMLHGVGSDGNDLISLVPYIQKAMPTCHFISPHGIEAYDMAPFGRQWFSLQDRTPSTIINLINNNVTLVQNLIETKQKELSLTNKDTILFGFSQGAMMGMYLTLITQDPYAATIAFSGKLIPPMKLANKKTPICLIHGKEDDVLSYKELEISADYFVKNNIKHEKLIIDNLTHSIDDKGIKFAIKFLQENTHI